MTDEATLNVGAENAEAELTEEEKAAKAEFDRMSDLLKNGEVEERIATAVAMGESHVIDYYPVLRKSAMNDPEEAVRKAVVQATKLLEDEFGEDECLALQERVGGSYVEGVTSMEDSATSGLFYNVRLNDYR